MPNPTPPLAIRSIEITNFRRIEHLTLEFIGPSNLVSDIAVFAGPNGCGKTTILEACLIALGYDGKFRGASGIDAIRPGCREWTIRATLEANGRPWDVTIRSNGHNDSVDINSGTAAKIRVIPSLYFSSWRAPKLVGALPITLGKRGKRPQDTEANRIWRAKQYLIDAKAHSLMWPSTSLFASEGEPSPDQTELERLNTTWRMFHPGTTDEFSVEPVSRDPDAGFDVFLGPPKQQKIPVDALSSGQLELFGFFASLMLAKFQEGIVVIDEPELHLDPQWHALMIRAIRRFLPQAQLIVATHSPKVYESVYSFQRFFLAPESDPRTAVWRTQTSGAASA